MPADQAVREPEAAADNEPDATITIIIHIQ